VTTGIDSCDEFSTTGSCMTESSELPTTSQAAELLEDFMTPPRQLEHFIPNANGLALLPTSSTVLASAPPEVMVGVGVSQSPPPDIKVPTVSRLRSEAGQQNQRERQKQRRQQNRQTRK